MTRQKSCLIGTICAYEVVPNWHDLFKFVIFLKRTHFGKKKKNNHIMVKKPNYFFVHLINIPKNTPVYSLKNRSEILIISYS